MVLTVVEPPLMAAPLSFNQRSVSHADDDPDRPAHPCSHRGFLSCQLGPLSSDWTPSQPSARADRRFDDMPVLEGPAQYAINQCPPRLNTWTELHYYSDASLDIAEPDTASWGLSAPRDEHAHAY